MIYLKVSYSMFFVLLLFVEEEIFLAYLIGLKRESSESSPLIHLYKVKGYKVPVEAELFWLYSEGKTDELWNVENGNLEVFTDCF